MFGGHFYHEKIRKSVAIFGALFNNLYVIRKNSSGSVINQMKVPLAYGPKQKFLERINQQPDLVDDSKVSIKLPRMSFEITAIAYDLTRQLQKNNTFSQAGSNVNKRNKFNSYVPYIISFQLSVYAKNQDDALQIVEQIFPYFTPQYTLTIKPFDDYSNIKEDIPISLSGISFTDDYEGTQEQRRTIIYTLDFDMKVNFYGPISSKTIIRQADTNLYQIDNGLNDSDVALEKISVTPNPIDTIGLADSDFGFTETITYYGDSA
jgi:hypothetical protein